MTLKMNVFHWFTIYILFSVNHLFIFIHLLGTQTSYVAKFFFIYYSYYSCIINDANISQPLFIVVLF